MRIGPLSQIHFDKLKTILDDAHATYKVDYDQELLAQIRERQKDPEPRHLNLFQSAGDYIFLEIEAKDALLIRGEVEKMGLTIGTRRAEPLPDVPEFLCRKCDYVSNEPGSCPTHQERLVGFSEWVADRQTNRDLVSRVFLYAVLIFAAVVGLIVIVDWFRRPAYLPPF